jgi:3-hydroxyisobutyrate dehydrogenase-like beta-hydroxyacid dehydrogenase
MSGTNDKTVSVIGLGWMGTALAHALNARGYDLTVWNRSSAKAAAFEGAARIASSPARACGASRIIVVCLLDYAAGAAALQTAEVEAILPGRVVVQFTTGTPSDARRWQAWANSCGSSYLDCSILGPPSSVGTARAKLLVAGPRKLFDDTIEMLQAIVPEPDYCGEEIGCAAILDHALLEIHCGTIAVLYHAISMCAAEGVSVEALLAHNIPLKESLVQRGLLGVDTRNYLTGNATMRTYASWATQLVAVSRELGVDTAVPEMLLGAMTRAIEFGHGGDDFQSLYETFRARSDPATDLKPAS